MSKTKVKAKPKTNNHRAAARAKFLKEKGIRIRPYTGADVYGVKGLILSIMETEFRSVSGLYPMDDINDMQSYYGADGEEFFVADFGGRIVGTIGVKRDDEKTALVRRVFVAPDHRGKGCGQMLMHEALDFCTKAGYDEVDFRGTSLMGPAVRLCEKFGFKEREVMDVGDFRVLIMRRKIE